MIHSLRLQNFRSYKDDSFEFEPGVNIIVGPNAVGKTNLLEAIYVLAVGSSFKTKDKDLVAKSKPWARIDGRFDSQERILKIQMSDGLWRKSFLIDKKPFVRLSQKQSLPLVLFEPNHLQLFIRGPSVRREYFDDYLNRSIPGYKSILNKYNRTLAQRNSLLKKHDLLSSELFAWNVKLCELAGQIVNERIGLIERLNKSIGKTYSSVANKKCKVKLSYFSDVETTQYTSSFLNKLEKQLELDRVRGFTCSGPHREDISVDLNGQSASTTASRGETRTLLLALKIFEMDELEKVNGQKPLLLLDDVFSELDGARRRYLVNYLDNRQTIITTTDADAVLEHFMQSSHKIIPIQQS
jgi:DNA replication and repair protein RecF